jgi:hypothetical protein
MKTLVWLVCLCATGMIGCTPTHPEEHKTPVDATADTAAAIDSVAKVQPSQTKPAGKEILLGDWKRDDAEEIIRVLQVSDDGTAQVNLQNPQTVRIRKATWRYDTNFLILYIESGNDNVPGSNYTLVYLPEEDAFTGQWYRSADHVTDQVRFSRVK